MNDIKPFIVTILKNSRGDDLYRATRRFAHLTSKEMDEPWGEGDSTPHQLLAAYKAYEDRINRAIEWVNQK